ncbi:hypothetical protein CPB84DRAFT_1749948 [Gymnopilus junonius]|uniref:Uncharacterized protein n=1 Tax=Gymnopilus junonius TaxID=109634 RepID=A0A9P5TIY2_GYMJU|nr:hypothetical protein CPB84DRAFT_1749948 [Gymnopilus junonius]
MSLWSQGSRRRRQSPKANPYAELVYFYGFTFIDPQSFYKSNTQDVDPTYEPHPGWRPDLDLTLNVIRYRAGFITREDRPTALVVVYTNKERSEAAHLLAVASATRKSENQSMQETLAERDKVKMKAKVKERWSQADFEKLAEHAHLTGVQPRWYQSISDWDELRKADYDLEPLQIQGRLTLI